MTGNADNGSRRPENHAAVKKLALQARLAAIVLAIGVVVMLTNMYIESEPGALPLLVVVLGSGWYVITRVRMRAQQK